MGMFDWVQCDAALPDGRVVDGPVWQSKDGPCELGVITITADGELMFEDAHTDILPEEERPYYGKPEWQQDGFFRLIGSMRRVVDRRVRQEFHGDFYFYDYHDDTKVFEEYRARFTHGRLESIARVDSTEAA